jgi:hypothetical protein
MRSQTHYGLKQRGAFRREISKGNQAAGREMLRQPARSKVARCRRFCAFKGQRRPDAIAAQAIIRPTSTA